MVKVVFALTCFRADLHTIWEKQESFRLFVFMVDGPETMINEKSTSFLET